MCVRVRVRLCVSEFCILNLFTAAGICILVAIIILISTILVIVGIATALPSIAKPTIRTLAVGIKRVPNYVGPSGTRCTPPVLLCRCCTARTTGTASASGARSTTRSTSLLLDDVIVEPTV